MYQIIDFTPEVAENETKEMSLFLKALSENMFF
jgi:hypothetical protein